VGLRRLHADMSHVGTTCLHAKATGERVHGPRAPERVAADVFVSLARLAIRFRERLACCSSTRLPSLVARIGSSEEEKKNAPELNMIPVFAGEALASQAKGRGSETRRPLSQSQIFNVFSACWTEDGEAVGGWPTPSAKATARSRLIVPVHTEYTPEPRDLRTRKPSVYRGAFVRAYGLACVPCPCQSLLGLIEVLRCLRKVPAGHRTAPPCISPQRNDPSVGRWRINREQHDG